MIREANLTWQYQDTESGLIMPCYTLPTLQWLKEQDTKKWCVFEFGAGYSTIWWNLNSRFTYSVDDNATWAKAMDSVFREIQSEYVGAACEALNDTNVDDDYYDCIVIDGKWRKECLKESIGWLVSGGYFIIDNWGQEDFPLSDCEFAEKLLEGWEKTIFSQPNHTTWKTAIFKKP